MNAQANALTTAPDDHDRSQALAQFASIVELVDRLRASDDADADGREVRHDMHGYYICTAEEATLEDEGNRSVGFDDRPHYATPSEAVETIPSEERARERIQQHPLSVEVRSGWYTAEDASRAVHAHSLIPPAEFAILLSTGGPACRLIGELDDNGEPEADTIRLEYQGWETPWTHLSVYPAFADGRAFSRDEAQTYLLDYARQFYFGE